MYFEFILNSKKGGRKLGSKSWKILILIFILFLTACQSNANGGGEVKIEDKEFAVNKEVTEIEVLTWSGEVFVTTIEDPELIDELVQALENAEINYTGNVDWPGPDYKLLFKHDEEVLYEIGYCKTNMNFENGVTGRYWEFDQLYKVDIELPLD